MNIGIGLFGAGIMATVFGAVNLYKGDMATFGAEGIVALIAFLLASVLWKS